MDARRVPLLEDPGHGPFPAIGNDVDVELHAADQGIHPQRPADLAGQQDPQVDPVANDTIPRPPMTHEGRTMTGNPASRPPPRARRVARQAAWRSLDAELVQQGGEALAVLAGLDRIGAEAGDRDVGVGEIAGQVDRRLAAEGQQHQRRLR